MLYVFDVTKEQNYDVRINAENKQEAEQCLRNMLEDKNSLAYEERHSNTSYYYSLVALDTDYDIIDEDDN